MSSSQNTEPCLKIGKCGFLPLILRNTWNNKTFYFLKKSLQKTKQNQTKQPNNKKPQTN